MSITDSSPQVDRGPLREDKRVLKKEAGELSKGQKVGEERAVGTNL